MFSATVFGISLLGLVTIFALKIIELTRGVRTPLSYVRSACDPLVYNGWITCKQTLRHLLVTITHLSVIWSKNALHNTHLFFDALMHSLAIRLNRYLRGRRTQVRQGEGDVSAHLKTVLEKTKEDSVPPHSL